MKKSVKWTAVIITGAIVIAGLLRGFAVTSCFIPSEGMQNSLLQGDRILVNKWSYGLRTPLIRWFGYHRWYSSPVHKGDLVIFNNPADMKEPVIDCREVFISRCAGSPGDTLWIDSLFSLIPSDNILNPDRKQLYSYPHERERQLDSLFILLSITNNELMGQDSTHYMRSLSRYEYYLLDQAMNGIDWLQQVSVDTTHICPLVVPGKGASIHVYPWNRVLLRNTLVLHEGKQAEIVNDTLYVEGRPTQACTFSKDYYWMISDNSINYADSRLFGFVPQDHLIGKGSFIWFSKETDTDLFEGYRWNRFFRKIK